MKGKPAGYTTHPVSIVLLVINISSDQSELSNSLFQNAGKTDNNRAEEGFPNERKVYYIPKAKQSVTAFLVMRKPNMSETVDS